MSRRAFGAWAWTALILVACWIPRSFVPVEGARSSRHKWPHRDKVVHFGLFAGFGLLWMRGGPTRGRATAVLVGGCMLAIVSELGQAIPIVDRDPDVFDGLADAFGLVVGMAGPMLDFRRNPAATASDRQGL